ncbi:MAG: hypothetical protein QM652_03340 [Legionella sp.]|uniref:hypothetical protein n=1 Tax=Legionella sp. TaxID=459 RepID=UPI0039E3368A
MTPLFPIDGKLQIKQGDTGDCYLLTALECIYYAGEEAQRAFKSLFKRKYTGVELRIKQMGESDLLHTKDRLAKKYNYHYDANTKEHVFFFTNDVLQEIDDFKGGIQTNSLAVKILERISAHFYNFDWQNEFNSVTAHDKEEDIKQRSPSFSTFSSSKNQHDLDWAILNLSEADGKYIATHPELYNKILIIKEKKDINPALISYCILLHKEFLIDKHEKLIEQLIKLPKEDCSYISDHPNLHKMLIEMQEVKSMDHNIIKACIELYKPKNYKADFENKYTLADTNEHREFLIRKLVGKTTNALNDSLLFYKDHAPQFNQLLSKINTDIKKAAKTHCDDLKQAEAKTEEIIIKINNYKPCYDGCLSISSLDEQEIEHIDFLKTLAQLDKLSEENHEKVRKAYNKKMKEISDKKQDHELKLTPPADLIIRMHVAQNFKLYRDKLYFLNQQLEKEPLLDGLNKLESSIKEIEKSSGFKILRDHQNPIIQNFNAFKQRIISQKIKFIENYTVDFSACACRKECENVKNDCRKELLIAQQDPNQQIGNALQKKLDQIENEKEQVMANIRATNFAIIAKLEPYIGDLRTKTAEVAEKNQPYALATTIFWDSIDKANNAFVQGEINAFDLKTQYQSAINVVQSTLQEHRSLFVKILQYIAEALGIYHTGTNSSSFFATDSSKKFNSLAEAVKLNTQRDPASGG